mgnify:CR=1 FL=1
MYEFIFLSNNWIKHQLQYLKIEKCWNWKMLVENI